MPWRCRGEWNHSSTFLEWSASRPCRCTTGKELHGSRIQSGRTVAIILDVDETRRGNKSLVSCSSVTASCVMAFGTGLCGLVLLSRLSVLCSSVHCGNEVNYLFLIRCDESSCNVCTEHFHSLFQHLVAKEPKLWRVSAVLCWVFTAETKSNVQWRSLWLISLCFL
jgi:hypothetical protein